MHESIAPLAGHSTFLATSQGGTRSSKALGTLIITSAKEADVSKSAHGLRKTRAVCWPRQAPRRTRSQPGQRITAYRKWSIPPVR